MFLFELEQRRLKAMLPAQAVMLLHAHVASKAEHREFFRLLEKWLGKNTEHMGAESLQASLRLLFVHFNRQGSRSAITP
jgi:hypothetical protein